MVAVVAANAVDGVLIALGFAGVQGVASDLDFLVASWVLIQAFYASTEKAEEAEFDGGFLCVAPTPRLDNVLKTRVQFVSLQNTWRLKRYWWSPPKRLAFRNSWRQILSAETFQYSNAELSRHGALAISILVACSTKAR